jgi:hypothetical protein
VLRRNLSGKLAILLLEEVFHAGDIVKIGVQNDRLSFC